MLKCDSTFHFGDVTGHDYTAQDKKKKEEIFKLLNRKTWWHIMAAHST